MRPYAASGSHLPAPIRACIPLRTPSLLLATHGALRPLAQRRMPALDSVSLTRVPTTHMAINDIVNLSRGQFAMTAIFHILWPILTISLSAFLLIVEILWVKTGEVVWYRHARFWSKLLVLNFAVGVVSGIP